MAFFTWECSNPSAWPNSWTAVNRRLVPRAVLSVKVSPSSKWTRPSWGKYSRANSPSCPSKGPAVHGPSPGMPVGVPLPKRPVYTLFSNWIVCLIPGENPNTQVTSIPTAVVITRIKRNTFLWSLESAILLKVFIWLFVCCIKHNI